MQNPRDAIIAITHRCNARCTMCNIWQSQAADVLMPEHMDRLPRDLATINITGGEPFLRGDIVDFVARCRKRCPRAPITISSNGILTEQICRAMPLLIKADPRVRLAISIDGIGAAHDEIRGRSGTFEHARELIESLVAGGYRGLRLSMTISDKNVRQLQAVAEMADSAGLELGVVAAHAGATHLHVTKVDRPKVEDDSRRAFERVAAGWLKSWRMKNWLRAHFLSGTYLRLIGGRKHFRCRAGRDFFFLQADGTVHSCSVLGRAMGNIIACEWNEIWSGAAANDARAFSTRCHEACWMICTARSVYRQQPIRAILWMARAKALAHLGLFRLPETLEHRQCE
mgnify:CR=1 FL=1